MTAERNGHAARVRTMFDRIARRYTLMNSLITFGAATRPGEGPW
jgi:ubiquinone/menaquinone biosynthesis C-methylase UbiE